MAGVGTQLRNLAFVVPGMNVELGDPSAPTHSTAADDVPDTRVSARSLGFDENESLGSQ